MCTTEIDWPKKKCEIVAQIVLGPDCGLSGDSASPWLDMRIQPFDRQARLHNLSAQGLV